MEKLKLIAGCDVAKGKDFQTIIVGVGPIGKSFIFEGKSLLGPPMIVDYGVKKTNTVDGLEKLAAIYKKHFDYLPDFLKQDTQKTDIVVTREYIESVDPVVLKKVIGDKVFEVREESPVVVEFRR